jgi:hypothetical protein
VPAGSTWKYNASGANLGTAWQASGYTGDAAWPQGPAQLGWGDGDERTVVPQNPRARHHLLPPRLHRRRPVAVLVADAAPAARRRRGDLPQRNPRRHQQHACGGGVRHRPTATVANAEENQFFTYTVPASALVPGNNVLAVEIHDVVNSSDISFDLSLDANRVTAGTGSGVPLNPGVNRLTVQAFDGPNGTGNEVQPRASSTCGTTRRAPRRPRRRSTPSASSPPPPTGPAFPCCSRCGR